MPLTKLRKYRLTYFDIIYPINKLLTSLENLVVAKEDHIADRHNGHDDKRSMILRVGGILLTEGHQTDRHTCNLELLSRLKIYLIII